MKRERRLFVYVSSALFFIFLLELGSFLFIHFSPLKDLEHNDFADDFSLKTGCTFVETIIVHPMLGFVHRQNQYLSPRCQKTTHINNIGIHTSRQLPLIKDKEKFNVMVLGGSVAHQFAEYQKEKGEVYLEHLLNEMYLPPHGKKFKVYTGAVGAWAMPNQLKMLLMYGERLDGVIALDGYNESLSISMGRRPERVPEANFIMASSSLNGLRHAYLRFLWDYHQWLEGTWLQYSSFFNFTYRGLSALFEAMFVSPGVVEEFSRGNLETLNLPMREARAWSLQSLKRYDLYFHQLGMIDNVLTAQFLQPTRLYGKELTPNEAQYREYADRTSYQGIELLYGQLKMMGLNVRSLTGIFQHEKKELYADHIHFKKENDGRSPGLELIAEKMAQELGTMWSLKKR